MTTDRRLVLLVISFASSLLHGQEGPKTVSARYATEPPEIDGRLDDRAWDHAARVAGFHTVKPIEYDEPDQKTEVYVLVGEDALYIAARLHDDQPQKIIAKALRQGTLSLSDDLFSIVLDPLNEGRSGYAFDINPRGIRSDALFVTATEKDSSWDAIWYGEATIDAHGWTAEIAIPYKSLSIRANATEWGINFSRWLGRSSQQSAWVSRNGSINPAVSGKLDGLSRIDQGIGLDVVPNLRISHHESTTQSSILDLEPALDVFYRITPSLTAALTLNTDFSGTDVDSRQINLSQFGVFFPEQRDFFLQDADVFEFGRIGSRDSFSTLSRVVRENGRPFFSRRIGLTAEGLPVDILGGVKVSGSIGRTSIGLIGMEQEVPDTPRSRTLFATRLSTAISDHSRVGFIFTDGDPFSDTGSSLFGADFQYLNTRLNERQTLEGAAWIQRTATDGLETDDTAFGASINLPSREGFRGLLGYKQLQENYRPALGFVSRTGVDEWTGEFGHTWRMKDRWLRSIYTGLSVEYIAAIDGPMQFRDVFLRLLEVENATADRFFTWQVIREEELMAPLQIGETFTIPAGKYSYDWFCGSISTGSQRPLATRLSGCEGGFYNGKRRNTSIGLMWLPSDQFHLELTFDVNDIEVPGNTLVTKLATLSADIAFTSKFSWENFVQYDNVSRSLGLNSILRWIPMPGRQFLLVANHDFRRSPLTGDFYTNTSDFALKGNVTLRF